MIGTPRPAACRVPWFDAVHDNAIRPPCPTEPSNNDNAYDAGSYNPNSAKRARHSPVLGIAQTARGYIRNGWIAVYLVTSGCSGRVDIQDVAAEKQRNRARPPAIAAKLLTLHGAAALVGLNPFLATKF